MSKKFVIVIIYQSLKSSGVILQPRAVFLVSVGTSLSYRFRSCDVYIATQAFVVVVVVRKKRWWWFVSTPQLVQGWAALHSPLPDSSSTPYRSITSKRGALTSQLTNWRTDQGVYPLFRLIGLYSEQLYQCLGAHGVSGRPASILCSRVLPDPSRQFVFLFPITWKW
jgi:hypothetical protein